MLTHVYQNPVLFIMNIQYPAILTMQSILGPATFLSLQNSLQVCKYIFLV